MDDVDQDHHPNVPSVVAWCRDTKVEVAYSNPCFELWLVLHFEPYGRPAKARDVQARLHASYPAYDHETSPAPDFSGLIATSEVAERRMSDQVQRLLPCSTATRLHDYFGDDAIIASNWALKDDA